MSRRTCTVLIGIMVLGLLLSTDIIHYVVLAVTYQAVILTSWVGVALAHLLEDSAGQPDSEGASAVRATVTLYHARGLGAWALSALAGFTLLKIGGNAATLSAPVSLAVALIAYRVMRSRLKVRAVLRTRRVAP